MLSHAEQFAAIIMLIGAFAYAASALAVVEWNDRRKTRARMNQQRIEIERVALEIELEEKRRRTEVIRFAERFNAGEGA